MLCEELGRLLTALPIYVNGIFGDDAIVGKITNRMDYEEASDDILLCITIMIRTYERDFDDVMKDVYSFLEAHPSESVIINIKILESLIYNPTKHSDYMLCKVYIGYEFYD